MDDEDDAIEDAGEYGADRGAVIAGIRESHARSRPLTPEEQRWQVAQARRCAAIEADKKRKAQGE